MIHNKVTSDSLIDHETDSKALWEMLAESSLLLVSPRRIGKTRLLLHLCELPRPGWKVVRVDMDGLTYEIV